MQVQVWLIVIGGEVFVAKGMVFPFRSQNSSFLQNKAYHLNQMMSVSVYVP